MLHLVSWLKVGQNSNHDAYISFSFSFDGCNVLLADEPGFLAEVLSNAQE